MFLRPNRRSKNGKDHTYWSLVETVRTPDGPRQRTLCYLGELNDSGEPRRGAGDANPEVRTKVSPQDKPLIALYVSGIVPEL